MLFIYFFFEMYQSLQIKVVSFVVMTCFFVLYVQVQQIVLCAVEADI